MTATTGTLADEVWRLMTAQGVLFAVDAPIRQTLSNLVEFFAARLQRDPAQVQADLEAALAADERFTREELQGQVVYVTSRQGRYIPRDTTDPHTFKQRLYEPEHPLPVDDLSVVVSTSPPAITTNEPVYISDYWIEQARLLAAAQMPSAPADKPSVEVTETVVTPEQPAAETTMAQPLSEVPATVDVPPTTPAEPIETAAVTAEPAAVASEPTPGEHSTIMTVDGLTIDLSRSPAEIV
ncbi:MAG: hypothetical protein WHS83_18705, partial [Chloroflexus sp.]